MRASEGLSANGTLTASGVDFGSPRSSQAWISAGRSPRFCSRTLTSRLPPG
jgi:hypothetical protein